jgi:predicted transcriptional regulator
VPGFAVEASVELAEALARRGTRADTDRVRTLLAAAAPDAQRLGMAPFSQRIEGLHARLPAGPPPTTTWCSSCRRWPGKCRAAEYDSCMKRITVSLPDELVEKIKRAAGGKRQVSSYVATALEDYQERETLDDILAAWREETPVPEEVQRQVEAELDNAGLTGLPEGGDRLAG